jgi:WD40 repeat protein
VSEVTCLAFSPDSSLLAAGTGAGTLKVWDTMTGAEQLTLNRQGYRLTGITFSPDWDGSLFPKHGRPVLGAVGLSANVRSDAGTPEEGTLLLFPSALGAGGAPLAPVSNSHGTVTGTFNPDGRMFVTGSRDASLRVWSLPELKEVACLEWHQNQLGHLAFSADGSLLMTAGFPDGVVRLWPWESLRAIWGS